MANEQRYRQAEAALWTSFGLEPRESPVPFGEHATSLRVQEFGDGPPVLFVHGGSAAGANWAPLVAALPTFRCIVIDRPGCGLSEPWPVRYDAEGFRQFASEFVPMALDALDVERAHVVATSFGGHLAVRSAAEHPERFDRLVELGYCFGAPMDKLPFSMRVVTIPGVGALIARIPPTKPVVRSIVRQLGMGPSLESGRIDDTFVEWFLSLLRDTDTMRNELTGAPALGHWRRGFNPEVALGPDVLGGIECPSLFIWAEGDPIGGVDVARAFTAQIPDARLELLDLPSHAPWVDEPERCAALISDFLP